MWTFSAGLGRGVCEIVRLHGCCIFEKLIFWTCLISFTEVFGYGWFYLMEFPQRGWLFIYIIIYIYIFIFIVICMYIFLYIPLRVYVCIFSHAHISIRTNFHRSRQFSINNGVTHKITILVLDRKINAIPLVLIVSF